MKSPPQIGPTAEEWAKEFVRARWGRAVRACTSKRGHYWHISQPDGGIIFCIWQTDQYGTEWRAGELLKYEA